MGDQLLHTPIPSQRMDRIRRLMFVEIYADGKDRCTGVLSNISMAGAAAIADTDLAPRDKVRLQLTPHLIIPAQVAWRRGRRHGFQFDRMLTVVEYFEIHASRRATCG